MHCWHMQFTKAVGTLNCIHAAEMLGIGGGPTLTRQFVRTMGVTGQAAKMCRIRCMLRSSILLRCGKPARLQQLLTRRIRPVAKSSKGAGRRLSLEGSNLACSASDTESFNHNSPVQDSCLANCKNVMRRPGAM